MKNLGQEFKEFIFKGNVIALAVAVIVGAAFTNIVTAVTDSLIMPIIAAFGGQPDFSSIGFTINNSHFGIGNLINAIINFLIIAAILFFLIIKPMNMMLEKSKTEEAATTKSCPYCKSEISLEATRCPNCTSQL